jgi:hypothetical protein
MTLSVELTPDFLKSTDWEASIREVPSNHCNDFYPHFFNAAKEAEEQGNTTMHLVFVLLGKVSSLFLQPKEKQTIFKPIMVSPYGRSADISDFTQDDIESLKLLLPEIKNNSLRARIADVVWTVEHKGNFQYAELAIDEYLISGEEQIFGEIYFHGIEQLTRALHLAISLGRWSDKYEKVIRKIDSLIEPFLPKHISPAIDLIKLLIDFRAGDLQKLAHFAKICAFDAEANSNWYIAGHCWEIEAKCHRLAKDEEQEYRALQMLANTFVNTAKDSIAQHGGFAVAAHHIQSAIEVLRRIPKTKDQQDQLHNVMLEYQQKSLDGLGQIQSEPIDLTPDVLRVISVFKGKPFLDGIIHFALGIPLIARKRMSAFVDEMAQKSPLFALVSSNKIDNRGKVIGKRGSMLGGTEQEMAQAREAEMFQWAEYEINAQGVVIDAARRYFITEHNASASDFLEVVGYNPFVPAGREKFFVEGFSFGMHGDFAIALSILVPQVENSIRYILNQNGVITSGLNQEGIQEDFDLNRLLDMPETAKIFHEDFIFSLRCTLTSRFGSNFRNLMAHGLLEYGHFYSYVAVYIWWLILRICCTPLVKNKENADASSKEDLHS